eukprot:scaffold10064_cov130-Isochrysis_galbana.AAC.11
MRRWERPAASRKRHRRAPILIQSFKAFTEPPRAPEGKNKIPCRRWPPRPRRTGGGRCGLVRCDGELGSYVWCIYMVIVRCFDLHIARHIPPSAVKLPLCHCGRLSRPQPIEYYACLKIVARGTTA